jgi:hypothetical protein
MLAHLNDSFRMATGELPVKSRWFPFRYPPLRQVVIYLLPVPKGAPTAPEIIARCGQAELNTERKAFHTWMEQLGHIMSSSQLVPHPAFGNLSYKERGPDGQALRPSPAAVWSMRRPSIADWQLAIANRRRPRERSDACGR